MFVDRTPPPAGSSTGGFTNGAWRVSNVNAERLSPSARVFASYRWGRTGDLPVVGDWDGDGTQTLGVVRPSQARDSNHLLLRNGDGSVLDYWFGRSGDRYLAGDWDGDGDFIPGVHRRHLLAARQRRRRPLRGPGPPRPPQRRRRGRRLERQRHLDPGVLRSGSRWYLKDSLSGGAASVGLKK